MSIIKIAGQFYSTEGIEMGDIFKLKNGNLMIINQIYHSGKYDCTILDPEEMTYTIGCGDFSNEIQNENIEGKLEKE